MLARTFTRDDQPAGAVGLTPEEVEAFVELISRSVGTDGLTITALDIASAVLAGSLLSEDAASPTPDGMARLSDKLEPHLRSAGGGTRRRHTPADVERP